MASEVQLKICKCKFKSDIYKHKHKFYVGRNWLKLS